jgi:peptide/nickel transport system permease protein
MSATTGRGDAGTGRRGDGETGERGEGRPLQSLTPNTHHPSLITRRSSLGSQRGYWGESWRRLRSDRLAVGALVVFCLIAAVSFAAPLVSTYVTGYPPDRINLDTNYAPPSALHWFGTDEYGRDYFTRTIWAGQISLIVGFGVAVVALAIGIPLGLVAGYFGGWIDDGINALVNIFLSLPGFFLLILLATLIPANKFTLAAIIGALGWTGTARQVRGVALSVKQRDYVEAARAMGAGNGRIIVRHLLPNISSIVVVITGFEVAGGILAESGLSFLGLGAKPPEASWGNMLTNSLADTTKAPWLVIYPGLFIFVTVLCIFLFSDGVRDAFDPRVQK